MNTLDPLDQYLQEKIPGNFFQKSSLFLLCFLVMANTCFMTIGGLVLPKVQIQFKLTTSEISIITGFSNAGSILGVIIANLLWQKVGPIRTLKFSLLIPFVYVVIIYYAQGFYFVLLAWIIQTLCLGLGSIPIGVYLAETAPIKSRGRWTVAFGISACCGRVTSALLSYFLIHKDEIATWKHPLYVQAVLYGVVAIPIIFYFQESLRYLFANKKFEELVAAINRIIKINQNKADNSALTDLATLSELEAISQMNSQNAEEKKTTLEQIKALFSGKYASITIVLILFWISLITQFAGLSMILPYWFTDNDKTNEYLLIVLTYTSEYIAMGTIYFMIDNERFGRKKSMQIFGTMILVLFGASYFFENQLVVTGFFFLERYCMKSILILLCTYTTEIYPTHLRNIGMSLTDMSSSVLTIFLPFAVFFLFEWKKYSVIVLFFSSAALLLFLSFFLWKDRTKRSLDLSKSLISTGEFA